MKMKTLGWPSTYLSRCPVTLFEAARGSTTWQCGGTMGELRMRPLGGAALHFQLNDLLDGQVLYEHAMRKPDAITIPEGRFFVIRQENGSFRGFGFKDRAAANEMRERIEKAIKPFKIQSTSKSNTITINGAEQNSHLVGLEAKGNSSKKREVLSCESVPKRSSAKNKTLEASDLPIPNHSSMENTSFTSTSQKSSISKKWQKIKNGFSAISYLFVVKEHEMEIGYPTDVKHVAHIGWDGPSVTGPSWMDELKPAPDFSLGPLSDFGQPQDPGWIHDAASAARWTSQGLLEADLPPEPPREFVDNLDSKNGNSKSSPFKTNSKTFFKKQKKQR